MAYFKHKIWRVFLTISTFAASKLPSVAASEQSPISWFYTWFMVKRFLCMVALAFTLQLSWGMVSSYCMHESGKSSQHFGHHQHQHQGANASGDEGNTSVPKKAAAYPDCASCTHSPLIAFEWNVGSMQPLLFSYEQLTPLPEQPAPYLGLPERPKWIFAA